MELDAAQRFHDALAIRVGLGYGLKPNFHWQAVHVPSGERPERA